MIVAMSTWTRSRAYSLSALLLTICLVCGGRVVTGESVLADAAATTLPSASPLGVPSRLDIGFRQLVMSVRVEDREQFILRNVTGQFCSGRLTAVMGPRSEG